MANEELILERLIRLTKSGKILWWRTGKGYKTKISKISVSLAVKVRMLSKECDGLNVTAPGECFSSINYSSYEGLFDELFMAILNSRSGISIDTLEEKLRELESREQANS